MYELNTLADSGSTGNNTHDSVYFGGTYEQLAIQLVVEAVGATPQITWKVQGSVDNERWYDLAYITDASDTVAVAAMTVNPTSQDQGKVIFISNPVARRYKYFRVVTSANTNTTYRVEAYQIA